MLLRGTPPTKVWVSDRATNRWQQYPLDIPQETSIRAAKLSPDRRLFALRTSDKEVVRSNHGHHSPGGFVCCCRCLVFAWLVSFGVWNMVRNSFLLMGMFALTVLFFVRVCEYRLICPLSGELDRFPESDIFRSRLRRLDRIWLFASSPQSLSFCVL